MLLRVTLRLIIDEDFLLQFVMTPVNKNKPPLMKLCKLVTNVLVNLPFFRRVDFGRLRYVVQEHVTSHLALSDFLLQLLQGISIE